MHSFPVASRSILFPPPVSGQDPHAPFQRATNDIVVHRVRNGTLVVHTVCFCSGPIRGLSSVKGGGSKDSRRPRTEGHFARPRPKTACGAWTRPLVELLCPSQCAARPPVEQSLTFSGLSRLRMCPEGAIQIQVRQVLAPCLCFPDPLWWIS